MEKIRVKDLAKKMKIPSQDLVFKLKSLGARVESEETQLDADVIRAILEGKRLAQPREVILRDTPTSAPRTVAVPQRQPPTALRPPRRTMIQRRVKSPIRNIEVRDHGKVVRPAAVAEPAARAGKPVTVGTPAAAKSAAAPPTTTAKAETGTVATEAKTQTPTAAAEIETAKPVAAETAATPKTAAAKPASTAKQPLKPSRSKARARLISRPEDQPPPSIVTSQAPHRPPPGRARPTRVMPPPPPPRRGRGRRPRRARSPIQDIRTYQRSLQPSEPVEAAKPSSERGRRRAQRKQDGGAPITHSAEIPAFKEARPEGPVTLAEGMTVREFAEKLGVKSKDLIRALLMRGVMANINHVLDPETAKSLADDLDVEVMEVSFEEEVQLQQETELDERIEKSSRAPVVTVMGHVDHGKTTLLDAIRETNVAGGEAGGITQHIGAYHVDVGKQKIVFLDTPGHEAFTLMRARGAGVTDVVILVVAADDGVMPQTIEAIDHARAAKVPIIIAVNKIDKENANPDRVKKELADHNLMVEAWGGDVVSVELSALQKKGIDELLEMILLQAELLELKSSPTLPAQATVLEAKKDIGRGTVATVLVQDGTLKVGDVFVAGATWGRVRSMIDDQGERIDEALPSTPIEVTGFNDLPAAGDLLQAVEDEAKARSIADFRAREERHKELAPRPAKMSLEQLFDRIEAGEAKELAVVLKADVHGSLEVVKDTLEGLSTEKVKVKVLHAGVGAITTNNVLLASASEAIIIGFNVRPERKASALAEKEEVDVRLHTVIYELADELKKAMTGLLEPEYEEQQRGTAEVRETFKVPKIGVIAGCYVTEGVIPRSANVRLLRDNRVVYEGKISSLKRFKDDAAEVRSGFECGIGLESFQDIKPSDVIEAFVREEIAPSL